MRASPSTKSSEMPPPVSCDRASGTESQFRSADTFHTTPPVNACAADNPQGLGTATTFPSAQLASEFADRTAGEVMIAHPKTLPIDTTFERATAVFEDSHVHMILLADNGILQGTLLRTDLHTTRSLTDRALPVARLTDRVTVPDAPLFAISERLLRNDRRLAVVDANHCLLGLLCLKRHLRGFCTDQGILARAQARDSDEQSTP